MIDSWNDNDIQEIEPSVFNREFERIEIEQFGFWRKWERLINFGNKSPKCKWTAFSKTKWLFEYTELWGHPIPNGQSGIIARQAREVQRQEIDLELHKSTEAYVLQLFKWIYCCKIMDSKCAITSSCWNITCWFDWIIKSL